MSLEHCGSADYHDPPLELLGEHPPYPITDRHRMYEDDFNALVDIEVKAGRVAPDVGNMAMSNFHVYMLGSRFPDAQHSPKFFQ